MTSNTNPSLQKKSAARMAAVQCLYTRQMTDISLAPARQLAALKKRLANNAEEQKLVIGTAIEPSYPLLEAILQGTLEWLPDIEARLDSALSKEWKRERVSPILIAILQCAIFELFFHKDAAPKIIIDEYTKLTGRFFAEAEVNFVHGALSGLHKKFHA